MASPASVAARPGGAERSTAGRRRRHRHQLGGPRLRLAGWRGVRADRSRVDPPGARAWDQRGGLRPAAATTARRAGLRGMTTTVDPPRNGQVAAPSTAAELRADGRVYPLAAPGGRELTLGRHSEGAAVD